MEFKALEYICAINDAKTVSQAAKNLFISQPALSQYLNKIEQEVGTAVFVRTGNVMMPTAAGELLIREGRMLLKEREKLLSSLTCLNDSPTEIVRFGISPFYSEYYLPGLFSFYHEHFPQIKLDAIERKSTELEQLVLDGELNLCFIPTEPMREGLVYRPIYMEEILIGLPPNHPANHHAVTAPGRPYLDLSLLRDETFVALIPELKFSYMSKRLMKHFSIRPEIIFRTSNWNTVCSMVASGIGVGLLPDVVTRKYHDSPVCYRIAGVDATRAYSAVYVKEQNLSHLEVTLIESFAELFKRKKSGTYEEE
ncbi:MAG: LysR family transcriptional regulator [bacterium]|nr:LysR family transcriptional regulator [bacterium]